MEKIVLENFGPLKRVELIPSKIMVFMGEQGTGKSIINRAIHYGWLINQIIKDTLHGYFYNIKHAINEEVFESLIRDKIENIFILLSYNESGQLTYQFNEFGSITYNAERNFIKFNINYDRIAELDIEMSRAEFENVDQLFKRWQTNDSFLLPQERLV